MDFVGSLFSGPYIQGDYGDLALALDSGPM